MNRRSEGRVMAIAALCGAILSGPVRADELANTADPQPTTEPPPVLFVTVQSTEDDNVFRLPSDVVDLGPDAPPGASRSDHIERTSVLLDKKLDLMQQGFEINAQLYRDLYTRNTFLNNTGGFAGLYWNWTLGPYWTGQLQAIRTKGLTNFADNRSFIKDYFDETQYVGNARYQIGPHWAVLAEDQEADIGHSTQARAKDSSRTNFGKIALEYATSRDDTITVDYRERHAVYPDQDLSDPATPNRDYHESASDITAMFVPVETITGLASAGYVTRDYTDPRVGRYSGGIYHFTVKWDYSEKTEVSVGVFRDLRAYIDADSAYFVAENGNVALSWAPRDRFKFTLSAELENQRYVEDATTPTAVVARRDKIREGQCDFTYSPLHWLNFDLKYGYARRESNITTLSFDDRTYGLSVTAEF